MPDLKALELRGFEFFCTRTAPEMSYFDFDFWPNLVLQLSRSEPIVLHAAIALGSLHEHEESIGMPISKHRTSDLRHRFAVTQYNTAIRYLRERDANGNDPKARVLILTTCLIFVHLELLRGGYDMAIEHVRSGLKILQGRCSGYQQSPADSMLSTAFRRLDLQCAHFDKDGPMLQYQSRDVAENHCVFSQSGVSRLEDINKRWDTLLGASLKFLQSARTLRKEKANLNDAELIRTQGKLISFHRAYIEELESLVSQPDVLPSKKHWQSCLLVKMHVIGIRLQLSVCLAQDEELSYDTYHSDFSEMLSLAERFMFNSDGGSQHHDGLKRPSLTTHWGVIPPLFLVASKCRDPQTRRRGIALLESWPHREGFWDAGLAVAFARTVMEIEEQDPFTVGRIANAFGIVAEDQSHTTITYSRVQNAVNGPEEAVSMPI